MLKVLTLYQPWGSAMALGYKMVETRSWKPGNDADCHRPVAIHAGKTVDREFANDPYVRQLLGDDPLPTGAILAVGLLKGVERTELIRLRLTFQEITFGDYSPGRWAWEFEAMIMLPDPVPCRGNRMLWELPPDIEKLVRDSVALPSGW